MPYHTPGLSLTQWRGDPQFGLLVRAGLKLGGTLARKVASKLIRPSTAVARTVVGGAAAAGGLGIARRMIGGRPGLPLPGGGRFRIGRALPGGRPAFTPGQCPPGFHVNKAVRAWELATEQGRDVQEPHWVNYCVKARSMNVTNPRALRRGIRRAAGFAKLARRVLSFVAARAPRGRAKFRRRK